MGVLMKKEVKLYNVLFPVWMLYIFPIFWVVILPANFVVDSAVLLLTMTALKIDGRFSVYKQTILRVWGIGFLSDILGAAPLFLLTVFDLLPDSATLMNLHGKPMELLTMLPPILLAGILIYFLNRRFSFRKTDLSAAQIHRLSFTLAIVTAPWTMLIPTGFLYGF